MTSLFALILFLSPAEVADSSAAGFTVKHVLHVSATTDTVYRALVDHVGEWWDKAHTWSGDPKNLSIEAKPGGCFCERIRGGGGVKHMEVVYVDPGKLIRLRGGLGPLQEMAVMGSLTFTFEPGEQETQITLTYKVSGYRPEGLSALAGDVDAMLRGQLERLGRFAETRRSH
jgi:hypothetical protein